MGRTIRCTCLESSGCGSGDGHHRYESRSIGSGRDHLGRSFFSSIVKAISWGRCVFDSIRNFFFAVAIDRERRRLLFLVFIGALAGFEPPLNAVQLLWVNLIMDSLGALALGTEEPHPSLLQRTPYKRSASLVSRPMLRNILVQKSGVSLLTLLLLSLLFVGGGVFPRTPAWHPLLR